jgi:hypothetical protein
MSNPIQKYRTATAQVTASSSRVARGKVARRKAARKLPETSD